MIKINLVVFLLLLQGLLVSVLLAVFALRKVRRLAARLAVRSAPTAPPGQAVADTPNDAAHYLATELQRTRGRLEGLNGASLSASTSGRLALRAELLQMEAEWAGLAQYDDAAWNKLDARLHMLLTQVTVAPTSSAPPEAQSQSADVVDTKRLFEEQHATIEQLKAGIASSVSDPDTTLSLQAQLDKLGRTARELTFCVTILEDENVFLREQVRALLQEK